MLCILTNALGAHHVTQHLCLATKAITLTPVVDLHDMLPNENSSLFIVQSTKDSYDNRSLYASG